MASIHDSTPCTPLLLVLTKAVSGVRHKHAGGGVHLVGGRKQRFDDDVLHTAHHRCRVHALQSQVAQEGAQRPLAALIVNVGVLVAGHKSQDKMLLQFYSFR